jgi:3-methylcrotonyl-CoA carboxylase alpha subunit
MRLLVGEDLHVADVRETPLGIRAIVDGRELSFDEVRPLGDGTFVLRQGDRRETFHCVRAGDVVHLFWRGRVYSFEEETEAVRAAHRHVAGGGLETPMPGKVIKVAVAPGAQVVKGDELVVVEAMKMENAIRAPRDGRVKSVAARVGDLVSPGLVLVELE